MLYRSQSPEAGFSLLETVIVTALLLLVLLAVHLTGSRMSGSLQQSVVQFQSAYSEVRAIAAQTNGSNASGALLVFANNAQGSNVTVLRGRPIPGMNPPSVVAGLPPLHLATTVMLGQMVTQAFTLAVAPDGHLDVFTQTITVGSQPVTQAPGCSATGTISLTISSSYAARVLTLACNTGAIIAEHS